jgi:hypothetical protein
MEKRRRKMVLKWVGVGVLAVFAALLLRSELVTVPFHMGLLAEGAGASDATLLSGVRLQPTATPLVDPDTLVSFPSDVVMFRRQVEYCQWQESHSNNQYAHRCALRCFLCSASSHRGSFAESRGLRLLSTAPSFTSNRPSFATPQ